MCSRITATWLTFCGTSSRRSASASGAERKRDLCLRQAGFVSVDNSRGSVGMTMEI
jgi:hypothetical protein